MFYKFNTLYKSLLALETITHSYLDTCYGEDVKQHFVLDVALVEIGTGIYHDWRNFIEHMAVSDYTETKLTDLVTLAPVDSGGNLAADV